MSDTAKDTKNFLKDAIPQQHKWTLLLVLLALVIFLPTVLIRTVENNKLFRENTNFTGEKDFLFVQRIFFDIQKSLAGQQINRDLYSIAPEGGNAVFFLKNPSMTYLFNGLEYEGSTIMITPENVDQIKKTMPKNIKPFRSYFEAFTGATFDRSGIEIKESHADVPAELASKTLPGRKAAPVVTQQPETEWEDLDAKEARYAAQHPDAQPSVSPTGKANLAGRGAFTHDAVQTDERGNVIGASQAPVRTPEERHVSPEEKRVMNTFSDEFANRFEDDSMQKSGDSPDNYDDWR
jgi:hypothetical protein